MPLSKWRLRGRTWCPGRWSPPRKLLLGAMTMTTMRSPLARPAGHGSRDDDLTCRINPPPRIIVAGLMPPRNHAIREHFHPPSKTILTPPPPGRAAHLCATGPPPSANRVAHLPRVIWSDPPLRVASSPAPPRPATDSQEKDARGSGRRAAARVTYTPQPRRCDGRWQ
jgi:hypothetical protein